MDRNRSGSRSGGVVKKRSSSGCLIVKKEADGIRGVGGSSVGWKLHELKDEKKRSWLSRGDVSSDEELLESYRRHGFSQSNLVSSAPLVYRRGVGNHGGFSSKLNDYDDVVLGRNELMAESGFNRNSLDVYDFDEYDDLSDVERIGMSHFYDKEISGREGTFLSPRQVVKNDIGLEPECGSSKGDIIYRRRNSFKSGTHSEKIEGTDPCSTKRKFVGKDEHPLSMRKEKFGSSSESIRLQGKNGVLKVMVKNKEKTAQNKLRKSIQIEGKKDGMRSEEMTSESILMRPLYSGKKLKKESVAVGMFNKDQQRKRNSVSVKSSEDSDGESEDSDLSPKLPSDSWEAHRRIKRGRAGGSIQTSEKSQPKKLKGRKVKRGSGTEKQMLREKIRNMLMSAGWTIDYRPRRGRDYSDAVYVNPAGTAYWSIIKAYDALQKQLEEEGTIMKPGDGCSSFALISEDTLSKLTRQTRKKIEKELKRKKSEEVGGKHKNLDHINSEEDESDTDSSGSSKHDEKLSSFIRRSGKSLKGAWKEACPRDGNFCSIKLHPSGEESFLMSNTRSVHGRESTKIGRCTLLIRNSDKGLDSNSDGFVPYPGKRNLLSWLIDSGTVKLSEKVHYMNRRRTRVMLEGWIAKDGIHCGCCSKIIPISKFEIHAASKLRQPYQNVYLSSGPSLLQCLIDAWNIQDVSQRNGFYEVDVDGDDPNDDTCSICGDGGNLICCDSCPSTFHQNCLDIQMLPPGDWHCPHCSCKFCSLAHVSLNEENAIDYTLLTCNLCEGKFHASCLEEMDDSPTSFCGKKCQELFERLQKLMGVKHELEAGLCWSLIHRSDLDSEASGLRYPQRVEWNSKIAVAVTVMEECFLPIIDRRSGINTIHNVLYNCGSNFTRLNYSGFYTAILERGDEIVSAASIRIRGNQFAEMPFIGTRHIYRHQGMCRRLFSAIESAMCSLKIEKLIIPAISELMCTWTRGFGFRSLGEKDKLEMKTLNLLAFPGTDMLQKKLVDLDSSKKDLAGLSSVVVQHSSSVVPDLQNNCKLKTCAGPSNLVALPDNDMKNDKPDTDFYSEDAVASGEECSLHNVSGDVFAEDKPSYISNAVMPLVTVEESQGTSFSLQKDTKLGESSVDLKQHGFPDLDADIHDIGRCLNESAANHDIEASVSPILAQGARKVVDDALLSQTDVPIVGISESLLNGIVRNVDHVVPGETLCSRNGAAVDIEHCFLSVASNDVEKPCTSLPAEGTIECSVKVEVDVGHEIPAKVTDVCSSPRTTKPLTTPVDGMCRNSPTPNHGVITIKSPDSCEDGNQRDFGGKLHHALVIHGVSSIQSLGKSEVSVQSTGMDSLRNPQHEHGDVGSAQEIVEGEMHHGDHDNDGDNVKVDANVQDTSSCEVSAKHVGDIEVEKPPLVSLSGISEIDGRHAHDISVKVPNLQPQNSFSCKISAKNDVTCGLEKTRLNPCSANNQPMLEGEMHHAQDINVEVATAQSVSIFETSNGIENPPSL